MEFISSSMYLTSLPPAEVYKTEYGERCRESVPLHFQPKPNPLESSNQAPCPSLCPPVTHSGVTHQVGHLSYARDVPALPVKKKRSCRRPRTSFTLDQLEKLETAFRSAPYPGISERDEIAAELGIPESRIQVWFQNRRARHRKKARLAAKAPAHSNLSPDGNYGWFPPSSCSAANMVSVDQFGTAGRWPPQIPTTEYHCRTAGQIHDGQNFARCVGQP